MSTRGILRPSAVGDLFSLERGAPPADLVDLIDSHWIVSWDLGDRAPYESEVVPHPSVHLVLEADGAAVYGVHRRRYVRRLSGAGWGVGTKFLPGGFAPFADRPISDLTDRVFGLQKLFGPAGERLARHCAAEPTVDSKLAAVHGFLRERLGAGLDERVLVVQAIVRDIHAAPPGEPVSAIADRHHLSVRTLQRLFHDYVGIGPKWVLQRYSLHEAIEQIDGRQRVDWTRFALDLGYYDHAHFNRDFRALVGRTPAQYQLEKVSEPQRIGLPRTWPRGAASPRAAPRARGGAAGDDAGDRVAQVRSASRPRR